MTLATGFAFAVLAFGAVLEIDAQPNPIHRGETLSLALTCRNTSPAPSGDLTLFVPLPAGLDQWSATVSIDGSIPLVYPANGMVPMGSLSTDAEREIVILAELESTSPSCLRIDADVLGSEGTVGEASLRINVFPSVDAGPDLVVELGGEAILSGALAGDGEISVVALHWSDDGAGGVFDDPTLLHPMYTAPGVSGVIELTLTATDEDGASTSDSTRVSVNASPFVELGGDLEAVEGEWIVLDGVHAEDPDGSIVRREWTDGGVGGRFLPSGDAIQPTYVIPAFGGCEERIPVALSLTVTDDRGAMASDSITLWVENLTHAPTVDAGPDRDTLGGQTIILNGQVHDEDGDPVSVTWQQVDGPPVDLTSLSQAETWFDAPSVSVATEFQFTLTATDACGRSATDSVRIMLLPETSQDTEPPADQPPTSDPEEPATGPCSLAVYIEITNERGIPVTSLSDARVGDRILLDVTVINTGATVLDRMSGSDPWTKGDWVRSKDTGAVGEHSDADSYYARRG